MEKIVNDYGLAIFIVLIFLISLMGTMCFILYRRIKEAEKKQAEGIAYLQEVQGKREAFALDSLETITLAVIQEQCDLSEGCIRVRQLLERYDVISLDDKMKVSVFYNMFEEIKDFDTHEDRQNLDKKERHRQDQARLIIENRYREDILKACQDLNDIVKRKM